VLLLLLLPRTVDLLQLQQVVALSFATHYMPEIVTRHSTCAGCVQKLLCMWKPLA
jgi:hypothetical protein